MREEGGRGMGYGVGESQPVRSFEDLVSWQETRKLVKEIYSTTNAQPFHSDLAFKSQIRRASISAMANIAEGHGRTGPGEYAHHLSVALGSLAELRSHLYVALDANFINLERFKTLMDQAVSVTNLTVRLRVAIVKRRDSSSVKEESIVYSDTKNEIFGESDLPLPLTPDPLPPVPEVQP